MKYRLNETQTLLVTAEDRAKFIILAAVQNHSAPLPSLERFKEVIEIDLTKCQIRGLISAARNGLYLWFSWEQAKLAELFAKGKTDKEMAAYFSLGVDSILARRRKQGLLRPRAHAAHITEQALNQCIAENLFLDEAAAKLGVSATTIQKYCQQYGLQFIREKAPPPASSIHEMSEYDRGLICKLYELGYTPGHIAKALPAKLTCVNTVLYWSPSLHLVDPYECRYTGVIRLLDGRLKNLKGALTPAERERLRYQPPCKVARLTGRPLKFLQQQKAAMLEDRENTRNEQITELFYQGLSDAQIGEKVYLCAASVAIKRHKLGLNDDAKEAHILKTIKDCIDNRKTQAVTAVLLGLSKTTIKNYCRKFGLSFRQISRGKHFAKVSDADKALIHTLYQMGYKPSDIARAVPVSLPNIKVIVAKSTTFEPVDPNQSEYERVQQLLAGTLKTNDGPYTAEELRLLRQRPVEEVSKLTGRPVQALLHKKSKLAATNQTAQAQPKNPVGHGVAYRLYTKAEIDLLQAKPLEQVASITGRSLSSLKDKKRKLARKTQQTIAGNAKVAAVGDGKRYILAEVAKRVRTDEDKRKFTVMASIYPCDIDNIFIDDPCLALGLSNAQLKGMVSSLCRDHHQWFSWEDEALISQFKQGASDEDIAKAMRVSKQSILYRRVKLGLTKAQVTTACAHK